MMSKLTLPSELEKEYLSIQKQFQKLREDYYLNDAKEMFISEDKELIKQIVKFQISVLDFMLTNYDSLDLEKYQEFLAYYYQEFYYGDDLNYLNIEDSLTGELLSEFCWRFSEEEFTFSKKKLEEVKLNFLQFLERYSENDS